MANRTQLKNAISYCFTQFLTTHITGKRKLVCRRYYITYSHNKKVGVDVDSDVWQLDGWNSIHDKVCILFLLFSFSDVSIYKQLSHLKELAFPTVRRLALTVRWLCMGRVLNMYCTLLYLLLEKLEPLPISSCMGLKVFQSCYKRALGHFFLKS